MRTTSSSPGFTVYTYKVQLSPDTERGIYDLRHPGGGRSASSGFVIPSQDEWTRAACFDAQTAPYWEYPTGPSQASTATKLDAKGNVVDASDQPLASYSAHGPAGRGGTQGAKAGTYPTWCPPKVNKNTRETKNPLDLSAQQYQADFQANLSGVGQAKIRSPRGTLDQGGNVVEWTDTNPERVRHVRNWRRLHGGIANAQATSCGPLRSGDCPRDQGSAPTSTRGWAFASGLVGSLGNPTR